jgi:hypothetical protein
MNKLIFLISLTASFLFIACSGEKQEKSDGSEFNPDETQRLEKEIMRLHDDELMPKMKDIQLMMEKLENRMKDENANYSEGYKKELDAAHEGLEDSYNLMMDWMAQYSPQDKKDGANYKLYLVEERGKLWKMKESFVENISYAKSTLDNEKFE